MINQPILYDNESTLSSILFRIKLGKEPHRIVLWDHPMLVKRLYIVRGWYLQECETHIPFNELSPELQELLTAVETNQRSGPWRQAVDYMAQHPESVTSEFYKILIEFLVEDEACATDPTNTWSKKP